ncbi:hypothetical protein PIB30_100804 [Stylosanthes scabra]|uniref:PB1-like domain-containing protein n=1 Tax=Stylosanthes scabra TaxID=79078 RepID=A0ABU6SXJ5_9FABA|nr:hypothetical protein [Stylosanthes scabra]
MHDVEAWRLLLSKAEKETKTPSKPLQDHGCMLTFLHSDFADFRLCLFGRTCDFTIRVLMMSYFVVPVLHHGGKLVRLGDGTREYVGGAVKSCDPMDVDFVNLKDLETLGKKDGLHPLKRDSDVNDMCDFTLNNNLPEIHIYFEHPIDQPIEPEELTESSSSSDSYESAEDEAYKPLPLDTKVMTVKRSLLKRVTRVRRLSC